MPRSWPILALLALPLAAQDGYFSKNLYPILEAARCRDCHNPNGVASATRIHFPEPDASAGRIEEFGRSLAAVVDRGAPEQSLLLNKPTNRIPHTGGRRITPGSKEETVLLSWVRRLAALTSKTAPSEPAGAPRLPASAVLRRLTHSQYNNTVRDLLGDSSNPANQFPSEDFVNGFKNQYEAQNISPLLAEAYSTAAEKLARNAFRGGDTHGLVPCKPVSASDPACAGRFVRDVGRKVFRRPLLETEAARYSALLTAQGDFLKGAQMVVEAMLQSPNFLFRVENGGNPKWRPYETASWLSYFLWDSLPDAALFQSAAAGELATPEGVEKAARRLLADPRARRALDEFVSQWLRFDRLANAVKDRRQYPQFTPELAYGMLEETRRLVAELVWNDRNFLDLFTADYSFLNTDLANLYKLPPPAAEFDKVTFPAASDRAGLLGQGSFLALTSKPAETSPTARGLFVREQFLCQQVPEPPPGVNTTLPPVAEERPQTLRERLAEHTTNETCAGCHKLIDPIGLGLEKFDAIGQRRDLLRITFFPGRRDRKSAPKSVELPLDTRGAIAGIPNSDFSSPKELGRVLAASPQCQECVVKQLFRYAAGRRETPADRPLIRRSLERFRDSRFSYKELMVGLVRLMEFP